MKKGTGPVFRKPVPRNGEYPGRAQEGALLTNTDH